MTTYSRSDDRGVSKCAVCHATVLAEVNCASGADAHTVCAACGMTVVKTQFEGCDYFDLIMRAGRPPGRAARRRRTE